MITPFAIVHEMRPLDSEMFPVARDKAEIYCTEAAYLKEDGTTQRCVVHLKRETVQKIGFETARVKLLESAYETLLGDAEPVVGGEN